MGYLFDIRMGQCVFLLTSIEVLFKNVFTVNNSKSYFFVFLPLFTCLFLICFVVIEL